MKWIFLSIVLAVPAYSATVHGKVQTSEKRAVSGAKVVIFHELSMVLVQRVVTDRNGVYRVSLSPGSYRMMVLKQDYHPHFEKVLLRSNNGKKNLTHELTSQLTVADQESMRNLKHILRNSDREPLKDLDTILMPQIAWTPSATAKLAGELTTAAKPGLDGNVDLVSQFLFRSALQDHVSVGAEICRERSELAEVAREFQRIDAQVMVSDGDWQVSLAGGTLTEVDGDGQEGSQHLTAASSLSGVAEWEGRIDFAESRRIDGSQIRYDLGQNLTHSVGGRNLDHQMRVQKWDCDEGQTAASADYGVFLAKGHGDEFGVSGHWASLEAGDDRWQSSEIRLSGASSFAHDQFRVSSQIGVNRHGQEKNLVHKHRMTAEIGPVIVHAQYDRDAIFEALDSTEVYGVHFRDPLVPDHFESFFHNQITASEMGMEIDLTGNWSGQIAVSRRQESADLISEIKPDQFHQSAELNRTRGQCVLENRAWAGKLSLGVGRESNDAVAFRQTEIAYAQEFCPFIDRVPTFSVMVKVARQPEVPAWWLLSEMPWDPGNEDTFYEGHLRLVF